jgi:hypothetical protein
MKHRVEHMTPNPDLTSAEIVQWFRAKAREFNGVADMLEQTTFRHGVAPVGKGVRSVQPPSSPASGAPTAEALRAAMKTKRMRTVEAARHFSVPRELIDQLIDNPVNGLRRGPKGWLQEVDTQPTG